MLCIQPELEKKRSSYIPLNYLFNAFSCEGSLQKETEIHLENHVNIYYISLTNGYIGLAHCRLPFFKILTLVLILL